MRRFPYERLKKIHLTERALSDFNKMQASPVFPRSARQSTEKKTRAYDNNFEQLLSDTGFVGDWDIDTQQPLNMGELKRMLRNEPIACSETEYRTFTRKLSRARNESKTRAVLFPLLGGDEEGQYAHEEEMLCHNLEPLVPGIADAKPDYMDGSLASSMKKEVRQSLSQLIVPANLCMPILPNFFLEVKGPEGSWLVLRRQILHDGCLGARGIHSLNSWGREECFNGKASTISVSFYLGILQIYCTHPVQQKEGTAFHTNRIGNYYLDKDPESLAEGLTAFRNARAWAKTQRDAAISELNSRLDNGSSSAILASSSSSATIGPLQQFPSTNNNSLENPKKRGLPVGGKENRPKRRKN